MIPLAVIVEQAVCQIFIKSIKTISCGFVCDFTLRPDWVDERNLLPNGNMTGGHWPERPSGAHSETVAERRQR